MILDTGWTALKGTIGDRPANVIVVPAMHISRKCHECGAVKAASRRTRDGFACMASYASRIGNEPRGGCGQVGRGFLWENRLLPLDACGHAESMQSMQISMRRGTFGTGPSGALLGSTRRQGLARLHGERRLRWQPLLTREINACDSLTVRQVGHMSPIAKGWGDPRRASDLLVSRKVSRRPGSLPSPFDRAVRARMTAQGRKPRDPVLVAGAFRSARLPRQFRLSQVPRRRYVPVPRGPKAA